MTILLVGLNHRTAPVELREKLALNGCALTMALEELSSHRSNGFTTPAITEGVIVSTCNRLEVYAAALNREAGWHQLETFLAGLQNITLDDLQPHLYYLDEDEAIHHLMRVACGLDSMVLGEPQILGQVSQAFSAAQTAGLTGPILSHLFSQAIHAGKRARTETDISRFTTSVSHAGAQLMLQHIIIESPRVLVIGAGEMAVLAARALQKTASIQLAFINRTYNRAEKLAHELGGDSMSWHQLDEALQWADAVITATGAPHIVIYAKDVEREIQKRVDRPLLFVDIAVPRDVEVSVGEIDGVRRFDIDDLHTIVDTNHSHREAAIPQVEAIIQQEVNNFIEWHHSREITPIITDLRRWATEIAQVEVEQALNKLNDADDKTAKIVNRLAHRLVNKILHEPTIRLRDQAIEGNGHGYAHAVSELFGLQTSECDMKQPICEMDTQNLDDETCNLQCLAQTKKQLI